MTSHSLKLGALANLRDALMAGTLRAWGRSLRIDAPPGQRHLLPQNLREVGAIYAGWHENLLTPACAWPHLAPVAMVSPSRDGEFITRIVERLGWQIVRGSSASRASSAARETLKALKRRPRSHFFVAADGPRGPRREFKPGAIYLASRTGRPIILMGYRHELPYRVRSWDRFCVPRPLANVRILMSEPLYFPRRLYKDGIEAARLRVQSLMDELQVTRRIVAVTK